MDQPFHDWGSQREGKGQDKAWWEVDSIVSGSYDGNTFVKRVLDHMSSQDEPMGGNPPTYGDLFRGKTRDGALIHLGRPPEPKPSGVAIPQVSSVVQVPGKAVSAAYDCLVSARSIVCFLFSGLLSCLDWQSLLLVCLLVSPGACWFYRKAKHSSKQYMQDTHIPRR